MTFLRARYLDTYLNHAGVSYLIYLTDPWSADSNDAKQEFTIVHEFGHRAGDAANRLAGKDDLYFEPPAHYTNLPGRPRGIPPHDGRDGAVVWGFGFGRCIYPNQT